MLKRVKCILVFTIFAVFSVFGMRSFATEESLYEPITNGISNAESAPCVVVDSYIVRSLGGNVLVYNENGSELLFSTSFQTEIFERFGSAEYTFDGVTLSEELVLPKGDYIFSGSLTVSGGLIIRPECELTLDGVTVSFSDTREGIRVLGGSLVITDSLLDLGTGGIKIGYSYSSCLRVSDSEIISSSTSPTITVEMGCVTLLGASVKNDIDAAIYNKGSLYLSGDIGIFGAKYDVVTEQPIFFSDNVSCFSSEVKIQYLKELCKGEMYEIIRDCTSDVISFVKVFDNAGREYRLTYFDSYKGMIERNFAAVYLPYTVRVFDSDILIGAYSYLNGERPDNLKKTEKTGYSHCGWYLDEELTEEISIESPIISDLDIYASYKLLPPEFSLSSMNFTYDQKERFLDFSQLYHPLENNGLYRLEWFYNGESIGLFDDGISLVNTSDSGEYFCKITFFYGKDSVTVTTPQVYVNILKQDVELPYIPAVRYNGKWQTADIASSAAFTVINEGGRAAGVYPVYLTLRDSENYCFSGVADSTVILDFVIEKSENRFTLELSILSTYANFPLSPFAQAEFGDVVYKYSDRIDGEFTLAAPTHVGEYYVIAEVYETPNYYGIKSNPISFSIIPERPTSISVLKEPYKTEYIAFEKFSPEGLAIEVLYNSGRKEEVSLDNLAYRYQTAEDLRYGDNAVIVEYLGLSAVVSVFVFKAQYDISGISFTSKSVVYNGEYHTIDKDGSLPCGKDGIPLEVVISGGSSSAGAHTVYLEFKSESKNYIIPERIEATLTIEPLAVEVVWGECEFIYDGKSKLPSAYFINERGSLIRLSVTGAVVNATDNAKAEVISPSDNYLFVNPTVSFKLSKADFDLSGVRWSAKEITYAGISVSVTLSDLPEGLSVIGYTDNSAIEVGAYLARAILSYDTRNYNPPEIDAYQWSIIPAQYDISGISFWDVTLAYDGEVHYPVISGKMPTGLDGIMLEYDLSDGAIHASDVPYEVRLIFKTSSKNYIAPEPLVAYVKIEQKKISVLWEYDIAVYDGNMHIPRAYCDECEITVSGGATNAGVYTAYAVASVGDYKIINDTFSFEIKKGLNLFTEAPDIKDFYESEIPSPSGKAKEGEILFVYYYDKECTMVSDLPLSHGVYYMRAIAPQSENYTEFISEPIEFVVIEVVPVGIEVYLNKTVFHAFDVLAAEDVSVTVIYNDGGRECISFSEISIVYPNGESLRFKDSTLCVTYKGFSYDCEITVEKADYDLSGVVWENTEWIYDGEINYPSLVGLPAGTSIKEYSGMGREVGEYTVDVTLYYDEENYNAPYIPPCLIRINPCKVKIPSLTPAVYCGTKVVIASPSDLYDVYYGEIVDAGVYTVTLSLKDGKNYIFEGGTDKTEIAFTVEKRIVSLKTEDLSLYLFERERMPEYSFTEEEFSGAMLDLYYVIENGFIYILSGNKNYLIESEPARLIKINRLSPSDREWVLQSVIMLAIMLLAVIIFVKYKDRIFDRIARIRCKRYFKKEMQTNTLLSVSGTQIECGKGKDQIQKDSFSNISYADDISIKNEDECMTVNVQRADSLISDSLAKSLLRREREIVYTQGYKRSVVNVDTLSENFDSGEVININDMKARRLVSPDTLSVKVLARGRIDKPLFVKANAFSLSAVKMIALAGGEAIRASTRVDRSAGEKNTVAIEKDKDV